MSKIKKPVLMPKADRREAALKIAVKLAQKVGAARVSVAAVAAQMKVTAPLLFHIFESKEGMTKAIVKAAKSQGVALPAAVPTVREQRAAGKKSTPAPAKKLAALLKPKLPTPAKPVTVRNKGTSTGATAKLVSKKSPAAKALSAIVAPKASSLRKPLTAAQREAKRARDAARRAPAAAPTTPAGKFASLPAPFEASLAAVSQ